MKLINKLLAVSLGVLMCSSQALAETKEQKTVSLPQDMKILEALGIYNSEDSFSEYVTRGELAKYMVRLSDTKALGNFTKYFYDVTEDYELSSYVNAAYERGIMNGYGNGLFAPNDKITYSQAVTCIMRVLGYTEIADFKGGYSVGFMQSAMDKKIFSLTKGDNEYVTNEEIFLMLYDALQADIVGIGEYSYVTDTGVTLMEEYFDVEKLGGVIFAYDSVGLDGKSTTTKETVMIKENGESVLYDCEFGEIEKYVGYTGDVYIRNEDTVICFEPDLRKTEEIELDQYDITEVSKKLDYLLYYDGKKEEKLELSDDAIFVYNGQMLYEITAEDVDIKNGTVRAVDVDSDDALDIVYVTDYKSYIVDSLNTNTGVVLDKCERVTVNLNLDDNYYDTTVYKNGKQVFLTSVSEWDVLQVADSKPKNGKVKRTVVISSSVAKGSIDAVTDETITISSDEYKVVEGLDFSFVNPGDFYIVGINERGYICCFIKQANAGKVYGYAVNCNLDEDSDYAKIKILNEQSEYVLYKFSEKARVNGVKTDAEKIVAHFAPNGRMQNQLVSYKLDNAGEIYEIYTAGEAKNPSKNEDDKLVLNLFTDGKFRYKSAPASIDGRYLIGPDTKIFTVSYEGSSLDEEASSCISKAQIGLPDAVYPNMYIYDSGLNCVAGAVVIEGSTATTAVDRIQIGVVDKISEVYDAKQGEVVTNIDMFIRGTKQTYSLASTLKNTEVLKRGDVVAVGVMDGKLANFSLLYTEKKEAAHDELTALGHRILFGDAEYQSASCYGVPSDTESSYYCEVVEKTYFSNNSYAITVKCFGADEYLVFLTDGSTRFYRYDADEKLVECTDYTGVEIGDRAFINSRFAYMRDIVLYGE